MKHLPLVPESVGVVIGSAAWEGSAGIAAGVVFNAFRVGVRACDPCDGLLPAAAPTTRGVRTGTSWAVYSAIYIIKLHSLQNAIMINYYSYIEFNFKIFY